jgi:hypothetical protein
MTSPQLRPDTDGDALVYVRTPLTKDELAAMLADGVVQRATWGVTGVAGPDWEITLSANPVTGAPDQDFVNWPWQLEFTHHEDLPIEDSVRTVTRLLTGIWGHHHWAVAACDYESALLNSGGWQHGHYIGQPTHRP